MKANIGKMLLVATAIFAAVLVLSSAVKAEEGSRIMGERVLGENGLIGNVADWDDHGMLYNGLYGLPYTNGVYGYPYGIWGLNRGIRGEEGMGRGE